MIWLATQLWGWMALAAVAGAALTTLTSVRRTTTTRWVERPSEAATADEAPVEVEDVATVETRPSASPFPEFRGPGTSQAPWEAEEEWSRPRTPV